jgi:AcrR family transcriptional regulator
MERKPKRRTRERILETSLELFNDFGEPNVTTQLISDEMGISPGNLYYHFHNKDEIIESLFADFERDIEDTLSAPTRRAPNVEDIWLFLHLIFEAIWKFRFLYRDINELLSRNRLLETHFKRIVARKVSTATRSARGSSRPATCGDAGRDPGAGDQHDRGRDLLAVLRVRQRSAQEDRWQQPVARRLPGHGAGGALPHGTLAQAVRGSIEELPD